MKIFRQTKRLWNKFVRHHQEFHRPGKSIKALKEEEKEKYLHREEFSREGVIPGTYILRNPKTGVTMVVKGDLCDLKRDYSRYEVVEPIIK